MVDTLWQSNNLQEKIAFLQGNQLELLFIEIPGKPLEKYHSLQETRGKQL